MQAGGGGERAGAGRRAGGGGERAGAGRREAAATGGGGGGRAGGLAGGGGRRVAGRRRQANGRAVGGKSTGRWAADGREALGGGWAGTLFRCSFDAVKSWILRYLWVRSAQSRGPRS